MNGEKEGEMERKKEGRERGLKGEVEERNLWHILSLDPPKQLTFWNFELYKLIFLKPLTWNRKLSNTPLAKSKRSIKSLLWFTSFYIIKGLRLCFYYIGCNTITLSTTIYKALVVFPFSDINKVIFILILLIYGWRRE